VATVVRIREANGIRAYNALYHIICPEHQRTLINQQDYCHLIVPIQRVAM